MSPGMTFNTPDQSIEVSPNLPTPASPSTTIHAGKKHPSTPPPPPIPPRSQRRPVKSSSTASLSSSRSSSPSIITEDVTSGQRIKLSEHVASEETTEYPNNLLPWFQQLPHPPQRQQQHMQPHYQHAHISQIPQKSHILDDIDREASNVCEFIEERLELAKMQGKVLCLHTKPDDGKRANAAFALCCYMMLLFNKTPEEAYAPIEYVHPPITPYRDAGSGAITFTLSILDCLRGLRKGLDMGLLRLDQFDVKEYEHYERVSNGDFNWITPFFIAFAGPKDSLSHIELQKYRANSALLSGSKRHASRSKSKSEATRSRNSTTSTEENTSESESTATTGSQDSTATYKTLMPSCTAPSPSKSNECKSSAPVLSNKLYPVVAGVIDSSDNNKSETEHKGDKNRRKKKKHRTRLTKSFQSVLDYFDSHNVKCVIRLNDKTYDEEHFQARGIDHVDLIYPDGTCPPWYIVERFLSICEDLILDTRDELTGNDEQQGVGIKKRNVVAVHCMAGLGRTGTLIGVFLMRHFDMTARETIAFLRLMRPGSVVGPQQNWLAQNEYRIRNRNWEHVQGRKVAECGQEFLRRMSKSSDSFYGDTDEEVDTIPDIVGVSGMAMSSTYDQDSILDSPVISLTPMSNTDYEQVFSRANSEGLESSWSETDFDSESESEFDVLESPIESNSEAGFSSKLRNGSTFETDESELEDVNPETPGDDVERMSMSTDQDTSEDEESESFPESNMPVHASRSYAHSSPSASLIGPSPLRIFHLQRFDDYSSPTGSLEFNPSELVTKSDAGPTANGNNDDNIEENKKTTVGTAEQLQSQSLGMEHIGDREYAIPVQPRKQQNAQRSESDMSSSSEGSTPFSNLTLISGSKPHCDSMQSLAGTTQQIDRTEMIENENTATSTVLHMSDKKILLNYNHDPQSPPSFNDDNNNAITADAISSAAMTTTTITTTASDVMESTFPEWSSHHCFGGYHQHKSSRSAGL
ncbi:cell division control protein 14 [Mortierella sp. AM989]|nr:cell division control protein 14 [Mortierella sp. AM989]